MSQLHFFRGSSTPTFLETSQVTRWGGGRTDMTWVPAWRLGVGGGVTGLRGSLKAGEAPP